MKNIFNYLIQHRLVLAVLASILLCALTAIILALLGPVDTEPIIERIMP